LLALLFGGLGIHSFYAGYINTGVYHILSSILCILLLPPVIGMTIIGSWAIAEIIFIKVDANGNPMTY